jgi:hypothetical protein
MKRHSTNERLRGSVRWRWYNGDGKSVRGPYFQNNQLTYRCGDVLARVLGGDASYAPRYVGFIYGDVADPVLAAPAVRDVTWATLASELADVAHANMQIAPITLAPSYVVDGSADTYYGNGVIFSAHTTTGASGVYGFSLAEPYDGVLGVGDYLYHAVLLAKPSTSYIPVARVSLAETGVPYAQKPEGFELALEWQVSFY